MVDTDPQAATPAPASDAPLQQPAGAVSLSPIEKPSDTEAPSNPIQPTAREASPQEITASLSHPSEEPVSEPKGKEKATTTTDTDTTTTSNPPPALPTKTSAESLSITPSAPPPQPDNPTCNITLLLPTGARHPYKIDERYLLKRSVAVPETTEAGHKDPFSISVYTLKELILREWREEWNDKPASPSSIRLIHFGKLLDDKEQLKSESL